MRVADTGEGMPPEILSRVFEPFFTTKAFGEGTGLGLSQVFGFAKQLGGTVTCESKPGEGSVFTLYLPVNPPHGDCRGGKRDRAHGRVLIVEDDQLVAELAAGMLAEIGFETTVTHSAKEALQRLSGEQRPTLLFTDIVMPGGMSGIELARKVRGRYPELPVLLTTGYSEMVGKEHDFPVLQKPYAVEVARRGAGQAAQCWKSPCLKRQRALDIALAKRPTAGAGATGCNRGGETCNKRLARGHPCMCGSSESLSTLWNGSLATNT